MSEKIYAWLLRLYPSQFREEDGDEPLHLFGDCARDEKGVLPRLRLWLDLLADLAISVPREHRYIQPALIGTSAQKHWDSTPSSHVLGNEPPRFGALLFGAVLSVTALSGLSVLVNHVGDYRTLRAEVAEALPSAHVRSSIRSPAAQISDDAGEEIIASGFPARQRPSQDGASAMLRVVAGEAKVNAEQQRVIDAAIKNLKEHYVDPVVAQKMANALAAHEKNGDYNAVTNGEASA